MRLCLLNRKNIEYAFQIISVAKISVMSFLKHYFMNTLPKLNREQVDIWFSYTSAWDQHVSSHTSS